jgi:hypothetical protein
VPFVATGRVRRTQMKLAEQCLADLAGEPCVRVVLIHHPPHIGGAPPGRNLTDAPRFEAMIARVGADLIIHGHNHTGSIAHIAGPRGPVPVIGAPSASERGGLVNHRAGYHLFTVDGEAGDFRITAQLRGLDDEGHFGDRGPFDIGSP